ncbi:hypothetical protein QVD17_16048 [Tagetes erecta]|uniref:Uncharacterized protein n=1 Tax=Tagetes erecta TaxID=13708 RepID=A0AAD8NT63_TARER|nr:hypothetical protein QVD17_16048 [Tagetes erecta]
MSTNTTTTSFDLSPPSFPIQHHHQPPPSPATTDHRHLEKRAHQIHPSMASGAAAGDSIFGNVFGGCISSDDIGIQRRPYHRNCSCALHKSGEQHHCPHSLPPKV